MAMSPKLSTFVSLGCLDDQRRGKAPSLRCIVLCAMTVLALLILLLQGAFWVESQTASLGEPESPAVASARVVAQQCLADMNLQQKGMAKFPASFVFGTATSAFQIEGGVAADGKGKSIWDVFTHVPGKIVDGSDADVADDSYNRLEADVALLKSMGVQSYRFSIAWARVLPEGSGTPNEAGIAYYSRLIDLLLQAGITPAATLYHWDLPQALQDKYGGWLDRQVIEDFAQYARLCFSRFGDRVRLWITLNEPQQTTTQGYGGGTFAPGRCSDRSRCTAGNSATEPYLAGHHLLMAHAAAVKVYRNEFQQKQAGRIGITLDCTFMFPLDPSSSSDRAAAQRGMEFQLPWFADPVMNGSYPASMANSLGARLPAFTASEAEEIRGSTDFLGLNFYTASYAKAGSPPQEGQENPWADRQIQTSGPGYRHRSWAGGSFEATSLTGLTRKPLLVTRLDEDIDSEGKPIGHSCASPWLKVVPRSIYHMLLWINKRYPSLPILITENGISQNGSQPFPEALCDTFRVNYHQDHLSYILMAIKKDVPVEAYYAWSLLDNFEWSSGYTQKFGIHYVDLEDPARPRLPKASAVWWKAFLRDRRVPSSLSLEGETPSSSDRPE